MAYSMQTLKVLAAMLDDQSGQHFGYELMKQTQLLSGSIYPILARLEKMSKEISDGPNSERPKAGLRRARDSGLSASLQAATAELKAGRLPEAEAFFTQAMSDGDSAAAALVGLGCIQMTRRDASAARARFLEALEKAPRMPEALFQIALTYWAEGNREAAIRWGGRLEAHHEGNGLVAALARIMGRTKGSG